MARLIDRLREVAAKQSNRVTKAQNLSDKMKMNAEAARTAVKRSEI